MKKFSKKHIRVDIFLKNLISCFLHHRFSNLLSCSTFLTVMKYADVKPIHKKHSKTDKKIIGRINILPILTLNVPIPDKVKKLS